MLGWAAAIGIIVPGIYTPSTGLVLKLAAASIVAAVCIAMEIVAETGARLLGAGHRLTTLVSPNVEGVSPDHNQRVFDEYARRWYESPPGPVTR